MRSFLVYARKLINGPSSLNPAAKIFLTTNRKGPSLGTGDHADKCPEQQSLLNEGWEFRV